MSLFGADRFTLLLLAGITLIILVLLRRAHRRSATRTARSSQIPSRAHRTKSQRAAAACRMTLSEHNLIWAR